MTHAHGRWIQLCSAPGHCLHMRINNDTAVQAPPRSTYLLGFKYERGIHLPTTDKAFFRSFLQFQVRGQLWKGIALLPASVYWTTYLRHLTKSQSLLYG